MCKLHIYFEVLEELIHNQANLVLALYLLTVNILLTVNTKIFFERQHNTCGTNNSQLF